MPATIGIRVDRISADLAAGRLRQEGIPAQVISDSDMLGAAGTPMAFSLIVPAAHEVRAREIIAELEGTGRERRRRC